MRLFVGVVPPQDVVDHLDAFLDVRREVAAFRWSAPEQWHVTLAFSGDAPERVLDDVYERLERAAGRRSAFDLRVAGGGAFPDPARARVLYAGVAGADGDGTAHRDVHERLAHLSTGTRAALARAGAPVDGQRFRPHLTIARLGHPEEVSNWVRLLDSYEGPTWRVDEISLIASHLSEGPRGRPRYEVMETFHLG
jgi:2'-5' RNA ligase